MRARGADLTDDRRRPSEPAPIGPGTELAPADAPDEEGETLFSVLAQQARSRNRTELWLTAGGGAVDGAAIALQYPSLYWLAATFAAVGAYGAWGLADQAVRESTRPRLARVVARAAQVVGVAAAIGAVGAFMLSALGTWIS